MLDVIFYLFDPIHLGVEFLRAAVLVREHVFLQGGVLAERSRTHAAHKLPHPAVYQLMPLQIAERARRVVT